MYWSILRSAVCRSGGVRVAGGGAGLGQGEEVGDVGGDRGGGGLHRGQDRLLGGPEVLDDGLDLFGSARSQLGGQQHAGGGGVGVDPCRTHGRDSVRTDSVRIRRGGGDGRGLGGGRGG